ncbi:FecR domain-containing protein [Chitinophagaceae bacterium LB-8]|uniref:FecR domain-containing protein n=1 Tax=Paraflavisolibacter caeni TaxID=2982496 RepID=A0A9X2XTW5_9BACT|nr:FecR domain-containing protein [Paraflavisolibacter caeni]MCU7548966.1 FecR domain-containing protein [Paraflavisolibacter caeni]
MSPELNHINDDLLVKYLLGETTQEEALLVRSWISAHPDHQKQFDQLKIIWQESGKYSSSVNENDAWVRFKNRIQQSQNKKGSVRKIYRYSWLRIAALFVVIAGSALAYFLSQKEPVQTLTVQTRSQPLTDTLPDGSVVTLNRNSAISYPEKFAKESRKIALKGEAFFNVTPDKTSPFVIQVNDVTIRVVGTSFNVRSEKGTTEVIVETGVVQVIKNQKVAELHPKERIQIDQNDSVLVKSVEKDQLYNYYRTKEFVCDNTPLWKLVNALNAAYNSNILIGRASLRNQPLTVTFEDESLDTILNIISETLQIEVVKKNGQVILQ